MSTTKYLLISFCLLIITACRSTEIQNFLQSVDPTGIAKTATQSSANAEYKAKQAEEFAASKEEGRIARIKFKEERDQWIGKNSDDLVTKWGTPYETYKRNDGGKHLLFRKETYSPTYDSWRNETTFYYCVTTFITNAKGVISSWNKDGYCPLDPEN